MTGPGTEPRIPSDLDEATFFELDDSPVFERAGERLRLKSPLPAFRAADLREALLSVLSEANRSVIVDLSEVDDLSTAIGQILVAFGRDQPSVAWVGLSPRIRKQLTRLGLCPGS